MACGRVAAAATAPPSSSASASSPAWVQHNYLSTEWMLEMSSTGKWVDSKSERDLQADFRLSAAISLCVCVCVSDIKYVCHVMIWRLS